MRQLSSFFPLLLVPAVVQCICPNPGISSKYYTTQDATVLTHIAYIAEFTVKCPGTESPNLYALFQDVLVPVGVVAPHKYQFSWTEDVKLAKSGEISVNIYDEYGYSAMRKAARNNEDISTVPIFYTLKVNLPGTYKGPWISCEFLAVSFSFTVAYFAFSFRSKLLL